MPYYHTKRLASGLSGGQGEVDVAVRSRFTVRDAYLLPDGGYEYRVDYGPDGKKKFVELEKALTSMGLNPWLTGTKEDCVLTVKKPVSLPQKPSRVPVVLALLTSLVVIVFSYVEVQTDQKLAPTVPWYTAFFGFGVPVVVLLGSRYVVHRYAGSRSRTEPNSVYLIPGVPGLTGSLPTLGFISYQRRPALNRDRYFDLMIIGPLTILAVSVVLQIVGDVAAVQSSIQLTSCITVNSLLQVCPGNPSLIQLALSYPLGSLMPTLAAGHGLVSPLGDGATVGFLLAFVAILPMASFDGGQISSVLWGTGKARVATYLSVLVLLVLDTNELSYWGVAIAVLLVGGRPLKVSFMDDISGVSRKRLFIYLGLLVVAFLALPIPHDIATIPLT
jgi:membrane-associated protease RseP (regulator of RpoE activity)